MLTLWSAAVVLAAAFVKGAIAFGFPTLATPLLALFTDVKTAVAVLIVPNIVMDGVQFTRHGASTAIMRRLAVLLVFGAVGTVLGTRLLVAISSQTATLLLGGFILLFVALNAARLAPRIPARWEPWLGPPAGLLAGIVGGITNVPGTPLVIYFYALGLAKREFVSAIAFSFIVYKVVQLAAVAWWGLLTWPLVGASLALTVVGLAGFAGGLAVQDRLEPRVFNRVVLGFLAGLGGWLVWRAIRW